MAQDQFGKLSPEEYQRLFGTPPPSPAPSLTPESVFGPVGQWLQTNVQPKLEQAAQTVRRVTTRGTTDPRLDVDSGLRRLLGGIVGGSLQTLAHPVENAEVLAPVALELARAFNPISRMTLAASLLRGAQTASPLARSAVAVGQSAERAALAGGVGGDFSKLVGLLDARGAIRYAEEAAEAHIFKAKAALALFPQTETLETLVDIADYPAPAGLMRRGFF